MLPAAKPRLSPVLTFAVLASLLIFAAALAFRFGLLRVSGAPEVVRPVVLQPLPQTQAERAKFQLTQQVGAHVLSTTQPIDIKGESIPFGQFSMPVDDHAPKLPDSDTDAHTMLKPVTTAKIVKFSNPQLCDAQNRCPFALMTVGDDGQPDQVIFQITAKSLSISTRQTNGNPDLLVDYGDGTPPSRLTWQTDTQFPMYAPAVSVPQ